jgi:hypothetical protein
MRLYQTAVTIQRPNGEIEVSTKDGNLIRLLPAIRKATAEAGRGKVLSAKLLRTTIQNPGHRYYASGCRYYTRDQGCPLHGETCR